MDHSTNPLSSELYKIRFKHSAKQWSNGRFCNYKEKSEKSEGNITVINCTQAFPLVPKRKKIEQQNTAEPTPSTVAFVNPISQDQKKKLADEQTDFYAKFFRSSNACRVNSL